MGLLLYVALCRIVKRGTSHPLRGILPCNNNLLKKRGCLLLCRIVRTFMCKLRFRVVKLHDKQAADNIARMHNQIALERQAWPVTRTSLICFHYIAAETNAPPPRPRAEKQDVDNTNCMDLRSAVIGQAWFTVCSTLRRLPCGVMVRFQIPCARSKSV